MFLNDLECGQFSDLLRELYVGILLEMVEDDVDIDYLVAGLLLVRPFDLWSEGRIIAAVIDLADQMQQVQSIAEILSFAGLDSQLSQPESGLYGQHDFEFKIIATVKSSKGGAVNIVE